MAVSVMTALPDIDLPRTRAFWDRFLVAHPEVGKMGFPSMVEPFGDSVELADALIELVVNGPKRATAGSLADYQRNGLLPVVGVASIATDGRGIPRAVLRTTEVRIGPLDSVDDAFAWDEGEGDRTRADWLAMHTRFFHRYLPTIGETFSPDMPTIFERFEVLYTE
jgi:uncharacterized protein YhfF